MPNYTLKELTLLLIALVMVNACTEPFEIETTEFENILVIDASITNEFKQHEIYLSRSFSSGEETSQVSGARVTVRSDSGDNYEFTERQPGLYASTIPFSPSRGIVYTLTVTDENGASYSSSPVTLTNTSEIEEIKANRFTDLSGTDGVQITVNGFSDANTGYFRYDYEETYRIDSWFNPQDSLVVTSQTPPVLEVVKKESSQKTCYITERSNTILLAETNSLSENKVVDLPVNFIERRARKVAIRYSILVRQYAISSTSYEFYETLKKFSSSDNLFSQIQPGLIAGNIQNDTDPNIKVIGLFETVSVSEKRIFFGFKDIFGNDIPYIGSCEREGFLINNPVLFDRINSGRYLFVGEDPPGVINIAPEQCVDCTLLGSTKIPEFWIAE